MYGKYLHGKTFAVLIRYVTICLTYFERIRKKKRNSFKKYLVNI